MRLGQLARKLDKKPHDLVDFLEKEHQITIDSDLNTKVEGDALDIIMDVFKKIEPVIEVPTPEEKAIEIEEIVPEIAEEVIVEEIAIPEPIELVVEEVEAEIEITEEEIEDIAAEAVVAEIDEEELDLTLENAAEPIERITEVTADETIIERIARIGEDGEELPELIIEDGVIKAPKQELDGFKVVGKIELPSAKRGIEFLVTNGDETKDITEEIFETRKLEKEARKKKAFEERKQRQTKKQTGKPRRKITEADKQAHAARRAAEKKSELDKRQAQKKKRHYQENVHKRAAAQGKKKKQKEIEKAVKKQKAPKVPEPTTAWGKFKRWLNT